MLLLFLCLLPTVVHSFLVSRFPIRQISPRFSANCRTSADLTPAVDKYSVLPDQSHLEDLSRFTLPPPNDDVADPFALVSDDILSLPQYVKEALRNESPVLTMAANHFFEQRQGKRYRPSLILLLGKALAKDMDAYSSSDERDLHRRLAQLVEMIHVASLIHDDVVDGADTRRGGSTVHVQFGNKVAVLAGDFLLARASVLLGGLQHSQVVEIVSSALDSLVQGELMQITGNRPSSVSEDGTTALLRHYLRKSYMKTASLICNSCKATALLSGFSETDSTTIACEQFGFHLGLAFQIVDDILDFSGASENLGKPAQADLTLGLATAPTIFASQQKPELVPLIERKFKGPGDVATAIALANETDCLKKSFELANFHAQAAFKALQQLHPSTYRDALEHLLYLTISRKK